MSDKQVLRELLKKYNLSEDQLPTSVEAWKNFLTILNKNIFEANQYKSHLEVLSVAVDSAAIVTITDANGIITEVNRLFCETSGYTRDELIGQNHRILKSGEHSENFYRDLWKTLSSGSIWRGEICNKRKDGSLYWVDTTIVPVLAESGKPTQHIAIRVDISARKNAEMSLITASKMAALGEMAAGIAHEINNPLTIISGRASRLDLLIKKNRFDMDLFSSELKLINDTVMRIAKIVRGLKTYSRSGEEDPFETILLEQVISETIGLCQERFNSSGVDLKIQSVPNIQIQCRAVQISQVLLNLLNNSFDAVEKMKEPWVRVDFEFVNETVKIIITDCGGGIPPHVAEKLMQPFYTTKIVGKGTGLGLSLSKSFIEKHNGKFWLDQDCPNTRFIIELPIKQE